MSSEVFNLVSQAGSAITSFVTTHAGGAFSGFALGVMLSGMGQFYLASRKQRRINEAILNKDIGMQHANLGFTTYRRTQEGDTRQRLRGLKAKFDLGESFQGPAQERYLEYLSRAAKMASESDENPYVLDYLEQAINECHKDINLKTLVGSFKRLDPEEIRRDIVRDLKKDIDDYIKNMPDKPSGLFDGVKIWKKQGTTLYPMLVAEKDGQHQQIKILVIRKYDLDSKIVPDREDNVLIRTASGVYENDPSHPHMLRWRTTRLLIDRMRANPEMADEMATQVALPPIFRLYGKEHLKDIGIIPRHHVERHIQPMPRGIS